VVVLHSAGMSICRACVATAHKAWTSLVTSHTLAGLLNIIRLLHRCLFNRQRRVGSFENVGLVVHISSLDVNLSPSGCSYHAQLRLTWSLSQTDMVIVVSWYRKENNVA
jgi:hypothetical protein